MTDILLKPTETWMPDLPHISIEMAKECIKITCAGCDALLEPIQKDKAFYYHCKDCSYCKYCGGLMEEQFKSNSPTCAEKIWVCCNCGVSK